MAISIQDRKIELISWLVSIEDRSLIEEIVRLKERDEGDWYDEATDSEKKSIESGLSDATEGKLKPNSEAKKIFGKWL